MKLQKRDPHDVTVRYTIDFNRDEVIEALTQYAENKGVILPSEAGFVWAGRNDGSDGVFATIGCDMPCTIKEDSNDQ